MRVSISKSKNAEQVYIIHSFRDKNGKSTSKIFKKLGSMNQLLPLHDHDRDKVIAWAREQAKIATASYNRENETVSIPFHPNMQIRVNEQRIFNCGYLFLQSLCSELRFDNICRNIKSRHDYEYPLQDILLDMIYARILYPASKKSTYSFAQTLLEQPRYDLHHIYRSLSVLADEADYIQSELYRNSHFVHHRNTKILYYDCTNYYFEIEDSDELRKYGKSKEHRPNPIVGMGLFMDADGIPLAFDIYPGNQNEQKTLKPLEKKVIRDFECSEFIFCSDSGLASQDNRLFNDMGGRGYVVTQSLKKLKQEYRETALNPKQFRKLGSSEWIDISALDETDPEIYETIYYKEVPVESKKLSETMIVTYSPKYKAYQKRIREEQLERARKLIENGDRLKKERRNPNDPARFVKKTAVTEHGEIADQEIYELDKDMINREAMYDGFYAVVTDIDGDVSQIISINRRRWQIEECFRIMKTEFDARPVYLQREDRIKAHFLICFIALMIFRLLEIRLEKEYTAEQIISTLKKMDVCRLDEYGYIPAYRRTELTDKLHKIFGFRTDTEIIRKSKMRSIIKKSKEKQ